MESGIRFNGRMIEFPKLCVGQGSSDISMYRGNFKVHEKRIHWLSLEASACRDSVVYSGPDTEIVLNSVEENGFLCPLPHMRLSSAAGSSTPFSISEDTGSR